MKMSTMLSSVLGRLNLPELWGVMIAPGSPHSGWSAGRGSGSVTSRPAPKILPLRRASTRASLSTVVPRPTLMRMAPSLQRAKRSALNSLLVSGVPGRLRAMRSASGSSSSSWLWATTRRQ